MKGYRTLLVNGSLVAAAAILHYIIGADLSVISPATATIVVAAANFALRFVTTTPVGAK